MPDPAADHSNGHPPGRMRRASAPRPIELWRFRGATDELRGLAFETSYGYAFGLELGAELVLLHLQRNIESMVAYADRIERGLIAQGWKVIDEPRDPRRAYDPC
jgi:hypothetical protein